jgi:hypothetical protein
MPENGEAVNTDVAKRNNAKQRLTITVAWRTEFGELEHTCVHPGERVAAIHESPRETV